VGNFSYLEDDEEDEVDQSTWKEEVEKKAMQKHEANQIVEGKRSPAPPPWLFALAIKEERKCCALELESCVLWLSGCLVVCQWHWGVQVPEGNVEWSSLEGDCPAPCPASPPLPESNSVRGDYLPEILELVLKLNARLADTSNGPRGAGNHYGERF
jgi:hypothetical protein